MLRLVSFEMIYILVLCRALFAAGVQTLSIDTALGTSIEDCFERISIGEQIPPSAIYRNVSELTTRECEQICKQDKQCQTYDYGVGAKGNATCNLSNLNNKELKEKNLLLRHPDYDVYIRRLQCEQGPPSPLKPGLSDEPVNDGPTHRPVFRPEVDDPRKPLADYQQDLRPFETNRPVRPFKPPFNNHLDDRPHDYTSSYPDFDRPPSYGDHRPQAVPYRPDKPKPDPYDVLQFQDQQGRPPLERPANWRPDPQYPAQLNDDIEDIYGPKPIKPRPPYNLDDKPQYEYFQRPNRRPRPPADYGNRPNIDYPPPHTPYGPRPGPIGPPDRPYQANRPHFDYPYRPYDNPSYDYQGQYASSYGQNQYQDNSIYLEIFDPPRPYRPNDRPIYRPDQNGYGPNYGYGAGLYGNVGGSQSSNHYSTGTITQLDSNNRPEVHIRPKPEKPNDSGYGSQAFQSSGYGSPASIKPSDAYKPSYSSQSPYGSTQSSYGTQSFYGSSQSSYGSQTNYGSQSFNKPNDPYKPSYGTQQTQDVAQSSYGSSLSNYGSQNNNFASQNSNRPIDDPKPSYDSIQSPITNQRPYGTTQSSYNSQSTGYGSQTSNKPSDTYKPSYGDNQRPYGAQSGYGSQNTYGSTQNQYSTQNTYGGTSQASYGVSIRPTYGQSDTQYQGSYQGDRPYNKPSYDRPDYERPSYGISTERPNYDDRPSYGNKPVYDRPVYGSTLTNDRPYSDKPTYGNSPSYDNKPAYGSDTYNDNKIKPVYNNRPSYDRPYGNKPYNDEPSYNSPNRPGYDSDRPDGDQGSSYAGQGYGQNEPSQSNSGYGTDDYKNNHGKNQTRPGIKPVYEYEIERPHNVPSYIVKPSGEVITSRPVAVGSGRPAYGREPGLQLSYKACFRRVLAGRRALRSFVRRVVDCERLEDCRLECAEERRFHCESFNYRLDPSFRGKGLCELMTKPIEEFDLRRDFIDDKDYDFYEVDRNSLEPHCPESLRGPGLLHSGFLSSKPTREEYQRPWTDRNDNFGDGYRSSFADRRYERFPGRRYQDRFYVPYRIGISRSGDAEIENWGQYGGIYGGHTYYKDRNDYHKSISHWGLNDIKPPEYEGPSYLKPGFNYHDLGQKGRNNNIYGYGAWKRGRWNTSGTGWNGLDYGESSYYKPPTKHYPIAVEDRSDDAVIKDCSSRRRPGMSLGSGAIRRSLFARNVVECEAACFNEREFKCVSYSYRYSSSHGSDNCFLSERPYRGLELSADSGSDVYAMPIDHGCSAVSHKPWVESECFWHVRSGAAVSGVAVRAALTVAGLGACEAECIRAHAFFCRGFSFRFDSPTIGDDIENCILTSSPPTSLETGRGLRPISGHELYSRGNYGRGCEPALYDDTAHRETGECYLQYDNAAKLTGSAVRGQARVRDEQACGAACSNAPFRCLSFSYNNNAPPDTDNCLLSEIRLFDLQKGVDYQHSTDDWLFAFDLFNGQCWRKQSGSGEHEEPVPELPRPIEPQGPPSSGEIYRESGPSGPPSVYPGSSEEAYIPGSGPTGEPGYNPAPSYPVSKPGFPGGPVGPGYLPAPDPERPDYIAAPSGPGYKPGYAENSGFQPGYPGESGFKPAYPPPEHGRPGYLPEPGYRPSGPGYPSEPFKPGYPDRDGRPGYPRPVPEYGPPRPAQPGPGRPGYPADRGEESTVSWRHYTVSGFPCKTGSACAQNQVAGHWACEPEGGEIGSWDYCCAPSHRCGYSEGFHKPWCYVGPSEDQWRPCSEKYYPYHQHNIPHPSQTNRVPGEPPRPWQKPDYPDRERPYPGPYLPEADRRYWDDLYKNGPQAYYDKYGDPLPGYSRVPMHSRPRVKYQHTYPRPGGGHWVPVPPSHADLDPPVPGGLGVPRYWPVAYLHKSPPPNMTYFKFNETDKPTTSRPLPERYDHLVPTLPPRDPPVRDPTFRDPNIRDQNFRDSNHRDPNIREPSIRDPLPNQFHKMDPDKPNGNSIDKNHRDEKTRNITNVKEDVFQIDLDKGDKTTTTPKPEVKTTETTTVKEKETKPTDTQVESVQPENVKVDKDLENLKGIDGKIDDFSTSIEVLDIKDAEKGDKLADLKTLEAEERQIEAIGRLLASRRGGKLVLEKRSQKDLETKSIKVDKDLADFNFGNKFPATDERRRGTVQRVSKDDIEKERSADKSLEVSETTFVRPPRVLSTTENIRRAVINGKIFYDATIREQRDIYSNSTRKPKTFRQLEDSRAPSIIQNATYGKKKVIHARNAPVNPVRKVRRVYKRRYNPDEVRRRLLEREKSSKGKIETVKRI